MSFTLVSYSKECLGGAPSLQQTYNSGARFTKKYNKFYLKIIVTFL